VTQAPFAVVNIRDGARRDVVPFLLQNDSFPIIENSYLFRGRIEKRSSFSPVGNDGRLKGTVGTTDGGGNITLLDGTVPGGIPAGVATFIINGSTLTDPGGASPVILLTTGAVTGTLNRTTGVLATNAPAAPVVYIPGLPVMGLLTREEVNPALINDELLEAFDTRYTYVFDVASNDFILQNTFAGTVNTFVWTGTDSDFFWYTNYFDAFWATNNVPGFHAAINASPVAERDGIRWFGTTAAGTGWSNFNPGLDGTDTPVVAPTQFLLGALIILPYQGRLVVLNTVEGPNLAGGVRFPRRARWCQFATPFYNNFPINKSAQLNSWSSTQVGKGGFIDAPTDEVIVSAEFIKDTLIVYFERSTWQLVYTNNAILPFIWQKINTELGSESTFSIVPFDRGVYAVGNYGIITTDSVNVVRLDQKIPDEVFQIQNINEGVKRVYGIRDYDAQLVYWTFPVRSDEDNDDATYTLTYPNQVLFYNYLDGSWAETDDCFTCFGYWQRLNDINWASLSLPSNTWANTSFAWNSQVSSGRYPSVVAGNQRGFVMVYSQLQNLGQNSPSLPIAQIVISSPTSATLTVTNHNLVNNQFILISGATGITNFNNRIFKVTLATVSTFVINTGPTVPFSGTYTGTGLITTLPRPDIITKEFNPFYQQGDSVKLNYIDILADRTQDGEFTINVYVNSNTSVITDSQVVLTSTESTTAIYGGQSRIWHRFYTNTIGSFFQLGITLSDDQMQVLETATANIRIHALIMYVSPAGRLSYDF